MLSLRSDSGQKKFDQILDSTILNKLKSRHGKSQRYVYEQHCDRLMNVVARYIQSIQHAEETLQDTFIQIFDKIEQYDPDKGKFESWTHRIAVNQALMHLRKVKASKIKFSDLNETQRIISNEALENFDYEQLLEVIDDLDEKYATLIKLRVIEGYEFSEIAEKLGLNESYARKILSRARRQLAKNLNNSEDTLANHIL